MSLYVETISMQGSSIGDENPLPRFKSSDRSNPGNYDKTFLSEDKLLFGYETGFRVLPYQMQDSYSRNRGKIDIRTIVLENEHLKAVFLADYGGRLASLVEKQNGRELLFRNSVFQPANLGIRDAWFSGGIEWNIGQLGHTVLTCSPLFFARMKDDEGNDFLRVWEYERSRRIFFSMDFHLPPGAMQLTMYVRIVNDNPKPVPMYWWTNIAVTQEKNLRVFSGSDEVIFLKPESNITEGSVHSYGRSALKDLPSLSGSDPSYPENFEFSSEYFFQTSEDEVSPWEAVVYDDGSAFFERSTSTLRYRKMFCWGKHRGGQHWCDYLSEPGKGNYVEIQAGMSPTQVHGLIMPEESVWEFTQVFGSFNPDPDAFVGEWVDAKDRIYTSITKILSPEQVNKRHKNLRHYAEVKPEELLHQGSGWGALERRRRAFDKDIRPIPEGFIFPDSSLGTSQEPWISLIEKGIMPFLSEGETPVSWMVDPSWKRHLEFAISIQKYNNPWPLIHLGVLLFEGDKRDEAVEAWQRSIALEPTSMALRNLSWVEKERGEIDKAIGFLLRGIELDGRHLEEYLSGELMELYLEAGLYNEAWKYFESLPGYLSSLERIISPAASAAFETGHEDFLKEVFQRDYVYIKEGETRLVDLWKAYSARRIAHIRNIPVTDELYMEVQKICPPPQGIDFMMS